MTSEENTTSVPLTSDIQSPVDDELLIESEYTVFTNFYSKNLQNSFFWRIRKFSILYKILLFEGNNSNLLKQIVKNDFEIVFKYNLFSYKIFIFFLIFIFPILIFEFLILSEFLLFVLHLLILFYYIYIYIALFLFPKQR